MQVNDQEASARVRAVCFDVDGTLVRQSDHKSVWEAVHARVLGDNEVNRKRMAAFREGRIAYDEWVALDVGDWQRLGVTRAELEQAIRETMRETEGARDTVEELARRGYAVAVVSGSIDLVLTVLLDGLPFDGVFINRIEFDAGGAIRGWRATPHDVEGKAEALEQVAAELGVTARETAFVGDHWNDLPAMRRAGFAVAFEPKDERLREVADAVIEQPPLTRLLDWLPGDWDG
jgi:phosphoserine phosphatase